MENPKIDYHSIKIGEIFKQLQTKERGLTKKEARKRLLQFGPNKLPEAKADSLAVIFLRQFQSPLIFILLIAAAIVFLIDEPFDSAVIMVVLLFNAIIGTIQEGRAQNIFAALKNFSKTNASVIRQYEEYIIPDEEVVPGDIIVLREGEKVPSDARLFHCDSLQIEEAALTGESSPKFKLPDLLKKEDVPLSERQNMIFKGTTVISGTGKAVVTATGTDTEIGRIALKITEIDEDLPLKKDILHLSKLIIIAAIVIAFVLFLVGLAQSFPIKEIFLIIVAVCVSVIPEGLPIVVTLVLATGVWRMGKLNVLVKRLQAVEALGQTSVIAVDKTGTVTKNELVVKKIYVDKKTFLVDGVGYEPKGEVRLNGKAVEPLNHPELLLTGKIGALCSSAHLAFDGKIKVWKISGDPTEAATQVLAEKIGFNKFDLEKELAKVDEMPFDYTLKYHAVLHQEKTENLLMVVGAPEQILEACGKVWSQQKNSEMTKRQREKLKEIFQKMSAEGLRVVAYGTKNLKQHTRIPRKLESLTFIGFFGIEDSPKTEVEEAVRKVRSAGIALVMITGDHKITAKAIASKIGIFKKGDLILEGSEVEKMTEKTLAKRLKKVTVFSRVTPLHKLKIITAYKLAGETIAMTGDGVNDALSLTSADVGVAMGKIGTEVAKEASDIILLDDNFGSIVCGVEEGRSMYKTIKRVILYLFATGLGELMVIIGALLLGFPLPILAVQILWLNLVTDGFLDVALAMEPKRESLLGKRKSSRKKVGLIDKLIVARMFTMAIPMALGTLLLFSINYQNDLQKAWTVSLTTLAVFQWFNAWNCRSQIRSILGMNPFSNRFLLGAMAIVVGLQFLAVYNPLFQKFLRTVPLDAADWIVIVIVAFSVVVFEEFRKIIARARQTG